MGSQAEISGCQPELREFVIRLREQDVACFEAL